MSRVEVDDKVEWRQIFRLTDLFGDTVCGYEIFKSFVDGDNINWRSQTFMVVSPNFEGFKEHKYTTRRQSHVDLHGSSPSFSDIVSSSVLIAMDCHLMLPCHDTGDWRGVRNNVKSETRGVADIIMRRRGCTQRPNHIILYNIKVEAHGRTLMPSLPSFHISLSHTIHQGTDKNVGVHASFMCLVYNNDRISTQQEIRSELPE